MKVSVVGFAATLIGVVAFTGCAQAGDAGRAWGTISNPGIAFLNSALAHQSSGTIAQQVEAGREGGPFRSVSACGTCTTITITGNNNAVYGNSITSTNYGMVSSNGFFDSGGSSVFNY